MASATKTIRQPLSYRPAQAAWFAATTSLFNQVCAFYFGCIQAHPGLLALSANDALTALERLTHTTDANPHPVMPLREAVPADLPALFRRAAIHAALGSAHSFYSHLEKWRKQKEKATAKGKKFTIRPPVPPRSWNRSPVLYAGQWKARTATSIMVKLWTGTSWAWIKCGLQGRALPDGWDMQSPTLVQHGDSWALHTSVQKKFTAPAKVAKQLDATETRLCAIDLNISRHLAVCTILTVEGTVVASRFIGRGKRLHGLRKRQLGRIARNRSKTGIIAEGEQDNVRLWAKVRALDEHVAHFVSSRILQFAKEHGASILVFEHLGTFKPQKGKYSKRANEKRSYWLRGKIFTYTKYKSWNEHGLITCRVSPRNTSRECARCGALVARYNAGNAPEGYTPGAPLVFCAHCNGRDNADRNASIVIGQRLLARSQQNITQEKPPTSLTTEKPAKAGGDARSQDAKSNGRPSLNPVRHGTSVAYGTTQRHGTRMGEACPGIPSQLPLFNES